LKFWQDNNLAGTGKTIDLFYNELNERISKNTYFKFRHVSDKAQRKRPQKIS